MHFLSNMEELKGKKRVFQKFPPNTPSNLFLAKIGLLGIYNIHGYQLCVIIM